MAIERFEQLEVWKEAHALALAVYRLTPLLPANERFGLVSQMQRAAVSVPANIAEGFTRRSLRDKVHFYNISRGSLEEVRYYFILCRDLGHTIDYTSLSDHVDRIGKMLTNLTKSLDHQQ